MNVVDGLLVGMIVSLGLTASLFFLNFWYTTRDQLFIAFAVVFAVEGLSRFYGLFSTSPDDRIPFVYAIRLFAYVFLIACIVKKNRKSKSQL
jgi:hypothetical protein